MTLQCRHCGAAVSDQYARVFGDENDDVYRCPSCDSKHRRFAGTSAGLESDWPDPDDQPNRNRGGCVEDVPKAVSTDGGEDIDRGKGPIPDGGIGTRPPTVEPTPEAFPWPLDIDEGDCVSVTAKRLPKGSPRATACTGEVLEAVAEEWEDEHGIVSRTGHVTIQTDEGPVIQVDVAGALQRRDEDSGHVGNFWRLIGRDAQVDRGGQA